MHSNVLDNAKMYSHRLHNSEKQPNHFGVYTQLYVNDEHHKPGSNGLDQKPKLTFLIFFILVSPRFLAKELKIENRLSYISHM